MSKDKPKIIVIMGPTASGKSDVAIKLAKKFGGEIISADSRQIYKGLNIGTGKVRKDFTGFFNFKFSIFQPREGFFSKGIRHHLIDVAKPQEDFNVSHFKKMAKEKIEEILSRKKIPIICGGTAFWIDALTKDLNLPEVPPDEILRGQLALETTEELFAKLEKLDPERAKNIDSQNKVRLIRAIEICQAIGKVPAQFTVTSSQFTVKYNFLEIGIRVSREILNEKIQIRLDERFKEGMTVEVEKLHKQGVSWEWLERIGLEYRWIARFLQGKIELGEMSAQGGCASGAREKLYFAIIHYAKRQMTWLQRNPNIIWCSDYKSIRKEVQKFLE